MSWIWIKKTKSYTYVAELEYKVFTYKIVMKHIWHDSNERQKR